MKPMQRRWITHLSVATVGVLAASVLVFIPGPAHAAATELYVATNGSDTNPGTLAQPFRSLERARQAVRDLKTGAGLPSGGVNVNIRQGDYTRTASFTLGAQDSGTAGSPVTYRAYNGEDVSILGGSTLAGGDFTAITSTGISNRLDAGVRSSVKEYDLAAHGITDYGEIIQTGFLIEGTQAAPELFFNDGVQTLARYPDTGFVTISSVQNAGANPRSSATPPPYTHPLPAIFDEGATFTYASNEPDTWVNDGDIWMYGYWRWDWADGNLRIESVDAVNNRITTDTASVYSVVSGQRYYYYNVLEELNAPGEYYVDRSAGKLYFYPPATLAGASISLSTLTQPLVDLDGASYVNVEGLTFHTARGDGVEINGGTSNRVIDNTFTNLGNSAVRVLAGSDHTIDGNTISRTGKSGIVLGGGDRATLTPAHNVARNNVIHDYSRLALTYNPGIQITGVGNEASHNEIYNAPHQAIAFAGNDHVIEYNHVHHVVQQTADSGAIYGVRDWAAGGTAIRYNYVHDIGGAGAPSQDQEAIYLDDMLSGIEVYGNILRGAPRPILVGGGRNNIIENNIVLGGSMGVQYDARGEGWAAYHCNAGGELRTKLATVPYTSPIWQARFPYLTTIQTDAPCTPKYASVQRNVFQSVSTTNIVASMRNNGVMAGNWETATAASSLGFVDFAGGDLRLRSDSPIYTNIPGFQPIPFQLIGPQSAPASAGLEIGLDNWTGTASVSTAKARSGFTSYKPGADQANLSHARGVTGDGTVTMWFYDDAADTTVQAVGNVPATGSGWRAMGVLTTVSASKYAYRVGSTATATSITRTTGWHRLTWVYGLDDTVTMSIDGKEVARVANSPSFSTVELGDWWADNRTGNVYFDDVSVLAPPARTLDIGPDTFWQGVHNISTTQVHSGVSSFAQVADRSWLTRDLGTPRDGKVTAWMYDDAADTSVQWVGNVPAGSSLWRAVGVDTARSSSFYAYRIDATWNVSTVARTTGWHKLEWTYGAGTTMTMEIDDQVVATVANSDKFAAVQLGDAWDGASAAVYFDDVTIE